MTHDEAKHILTYAEMMKKLPCVLHELGYPCYQEVKDTLLSSYLFF